MTALVAGSPEWLAERETYLGGTDMARILGMSRFGGPMSVYMERTHQSAPLLETSRMKWGKLLEDPVAQEYARHSGRKVRRAAGLVRHPAIPYLGGNIDRWSFLKGTPKRVLEVKTADVFAATDFGEQDTDEVPPDYLVQAMHYIDVTGTDVCDIACLIGGNREWYGSIPRNDELIAEMHDEAEKFWRDTAQGIPPAIDGTEASAQYLALTYADRGTERPMDETLEKLAYEYEAARAAAKEDEERKATIGNAIRDLMGNDSIARDRGLKITYSEVKGRTTVNSAGWIESLEKMVDEIASHLDIDWMTGHVKIRDAHAPGLSRAVLPYMPGIPSAYGVGLEGLARLYTTTAEPTRALRVTIRE